MLQQCVLCQEVSILSELAVDWDPPTALSCAVVAGTVCERRMVVLITHSSVMRSLVIWQGLKLNRRLGL